MLVKTRGIVFRAVKYAETSLITDIYTRELGLQTYIVNGVRSARSKTGAAQFQVMSLADVVAYHRDDRKMHRVKEIRAAYVYQRLPFDVRRSAVGLFMAEIARKTIREAEPNSPLFDFLFDSFCFLDSTPHSFANLHLHFLIGLSACLGFLPGGDFTPQTPVFDMQEGVFTQQTHHLHCMDEEQSLLLYQLLCCEREQCHLIAMHHAQRRRLLQSLLSFYRLHIESLPDIHSHEILHEVFE